MYLCAYILVLITSTTELLSLNFILILYYFFLYNQIYTFLLSRLVLSVQCRTPLHTTNMYTN